VLLDEAGQFQDIFGLKNKNGDVSLKNNIVLLKNNKKIFQVKIRSSQNSKLGDSDIILNAGKDMCFDHVVLGNYFKHYKLPELKIGSISWHGYYQVIDDHQLYSPVVHIKSRGTIIDKVGHLGSVNKFEPFAFPVCSLYVPNDLNTDGIGSTRKNLDESIYLDIPQTNNNPRFDFFVLPEGLTLERLNNSPLMLLYRFADLEIFNNPDDGHNIVLNAYIELFKNVGDNDVLIRIVEDPSSIDIASNSGEQIYKEISDQYSIIINDPNDIYNKLANKPVIMCDENGNMMKPRLLKDMHEEEINFNPTSKIGIWDDFYNNND